MTDSNTKRQAVREKVAFDEDALTGKISDVIVALLTAQALVPEEYRADARIEVTGQSGWNAGDATVEAEVFYDADKRRTRTPP